MEEVGFVVWGLWFRVCGLGFVIWGLWFGIWDLGIMVWGLALAVQGSAFGI
jgi:hypothetical protein